MVQLSDQDRKELIKFIEEHSMRNKYIDPNEIDNKIKKKIFQLRKKKNLPSYIGKMVAQIKDLANYLKGEKATDLEKEQITSALNYFILAEDKIPDYKPIVGYLDDAYIISVVHKQILSDTNH